MPAPGTDGACQLLYIAAPPCLPPLLVLRILRLLPRRRFLCPAGAPQCPEGTVQEGRPPSEEPKKAPHSRSPLTEPADKGGAHHFSRRPPAPGPRQGFPMDAVAEHRVEPTLCPRHQALGKGDWRPRAPLQSGGGPRAARTPESWMDGKLPGGLPGGGGEILGPGPLLVGSPPSPPAPRPSCT